MANIGRLFSRAKFHEQREELLLLGYSDQTHVCKRGEKRIFFVFAFHATIYMALGVLAQLRCVFVCVKCVGNSLVHSMHNTQNKFQRNLYQRTT